MSRSPYLSRLSKNVVSSEFCSSNQTQFGQFLSPSRTTTHPLHHSHSSAPLSSKQRLCESASPGERVQTVTSPLLSHNSPSSPFRSPAIKNLRSVDSPFIKEFTRKTEAQTRTTVKLGKGRFGLVVAGIYKGAVTAVKISSPVGQTSLEALNESESRALLLSHPNIIRTCKVEKLTDKVVVVMELWGRCNLQQYLSETSSIEFREKLSIATQLASALSYCHKKEILHLDVKPANVMVDNRCGNIKLGDFGNSQRSSCTARKLNSIGTIPYCAPEIVRGELVSWHCDVFSYGVTLWQIESQRDPYEGHNLTSVAYLVVSQGMRPTNETPDSQLAGIYTKCWSTERENRPCMQSVLDTLKEINAEAIGKEEKCI